MNVGRLFLFTVILSQLSCAHAATQTTPLSPLGTNDFSAVSTLEQELLITTSETERIMLRRRLISLLGSLANRSPAEVTASARVMALARIDRLYQELEGLGSANEELYRDYYDHGYFLANYGFGEPIRSAYFVKTPVPDYTRALLMFREALNSPDAKVREWSQLEIDSIVTPVLSVGGWLYNERDAIVGVAMRNLDLAILKLECSDGAVTEIQEWSCTLAGTSDHAVQIRYYRITDLPKCTNLILTARTMSGMSDSQRLSRFDEKTEDLAARASRDMYTWRYLDNVSPVSLSNPFLAFRRQHAFNQKCSLCHIPHHASE